MPAQAAGRRRFLPMTEPRVLFAGTPAFALASLEALVAQGIVPLAVLTQPDRPAGRGRRLAASPVKQFAAAHGIPVLQPATLRGESAGPVIAELRSLSPDLMIVAAYGLLLPQAVLDLPVHGCVNVHASLLPRWRGAAPIQHAILAGDAETGISLMQMAAGLDTGPVFVQRALPIGERDTAGSLHDRLALQGGELLVENLPRILAGELTPEPQDDALAVYAPKLAAAEAELDWREPAPRLARRVRAYNPVPGAWFACRGERVKCWQASPVAAMPGQPGAVSTSGGFVVLCADGALSLEVLQRPGRRPVSAREFADQLDLDGEVLPLAAGANGAGRP